MDIWVGRVRRAHGLLQSFQFGLPLSDHIQRSDHIAQRVCRHADSSCEKKERCDDHSDSDESELATSAAFSVFWMRNRKNLDEESESRIEFDLLAFLMLVGMTSSPHSNLARLRLDG